MNVAWFVRIRQLASQMRFLTAIVGYDPRDHSINQSIYLIYITAFFSLWGFAMLAFIADLGAGLLSLFENFTPIQTAILLITAVLIADVLLRSYIYAKRSPFNFTNEDFALICQTTVDRRQVAFAWLFGDWLPAGLPYLAGAVVLSFACQQLAAPEGMIWTHLPIYIFTGFRVVVIMFPLHLACMTLTYTFGALRLRREKDLTYLRWFPLGIGFCLFLLAVFLPKSLRILLSPILYPLEAGFGLENWLLGFILVGSLVVLSLLGLYLVTPRLNLSRASQESSSHRRLKEMDLRRDESRKGISNGLEIFVRYIPSGSGIWILFWKDMVQTLRGVRIKSIMSWLAIFGTSLGMMVATDIGTRLWVYVVWGLLIGQVCSKRFNSDLNLWVIFRQLPLSSRKIVLAEIARPVIGVTLLSWLGFGICSLLNLKPSLTVAILALGITLCFTLASLLDIVRQSKADDLTTGNRAEMGILGLGLGLILAGIPLILAIWMSSWITGFIGVWIASLLSLSLSLGIAYGLWQLIAYQYGKI